MTTLDKTVRLSDVIAPKFFPVHKAVKGGEYQSFVLKGGRGSTKSSFAAVEVILGIIADPSANALVLRKVGDTIRYSVLTTLLWATEALGVAHLFDHTRSPAELRYIPTGQKIIMKGLDDPMKIKSIKVEKGYIKILWFEEGAEFDGLEELRSVQQSVIRGGDKFLELITYNPPNDPANWLNEDTQIQRPRRMVHHSTYLDVPPEWLGKRFIELAETLQRENDVAYAHEYLGQAVGRAEQIIFHGKWEVREFESARNERKFLGADWGFANDPSVLVSSFIRKAEDGREDLYIEHEAFGYGVELEELPQLFDTVPESRKWPMKGDNSRPETISFMRRKGFNIAPADKWQGSVEDGIAHLKGFRKIYIHPRCKGLIEEARMYSYKVDRKTGDVLPIIIDAFNHGWDSVRYSLDGYIQKRGGLGVWAKLASKR